MSDREHWDARYRSSNSVWSGDPNPQLIAEVAELAPGRALDAGCGEGADAIWLAERGWHVTACDISGVALEHARAVDVDDAVRGRIEWQQADLVTDAPPAGSYDLVSAHFMQLPPEQREALLRGLAAAVKPDGTLLVVAHHPSDLQTTARRPPRPEVFYTPEDVAALLEPQQWEILTSVARPRSVTDPAGNAVTVHDTVLRARRRA